MTLNDLLKRIDIEKDKDKMFVFREDIGWDNVKFEVKDSEITVILDKNKPFSSDN